MSFNLGNTFVNKKSTLNAPDSHLWIILSYPFGDPEQIVIVNLTTWRTEAIELNDSACIVNAGEHKFVQGKSCISYSHTRLAKMKDLEQAINEGLVVSHQDCSDELLNKILAGAAKSQFIPLGMIRILQQQELIN